MNGFLKMMLAVLHAAFWWLVMGMWGCASPPSEPPDTGFVEHPAAPILATVRNDTLDDRERLWVKVKRREAASGSCLSKARAQRLTIRAVPDSAFVNPTDLSQVPPWPYDTTRVYPELHDPATGETWVGTECQVWTQILDVGMGAAANYEWSVSYPYRRYRILFAVMTPTKFGYYDQLFARDTGIVISPRDGWTPPLALP